MTKTGAKRKRQVTQYSSSNIKRLTRYQLMLCIGNTTSNIPHLPFSSTPSSKPTIQIFLIVLTTSAKTRDMVTVSRIRISRVVGNIADGTRNNDQPLEMVLSSSQDLQVCKNNSNHPFTNTFKGPIDLSNYNVALTSIKYSDKFTRGAPAPPQKPKI